MFCASQSNAYIPTESRATWPVYQSARADAAEPLPHDSGISRESEQLQAEHMDTVEKKNVVQPSADDTIQSYRPKGAVSNQGDVQTSLLEESEPEASSQAEKLSALKDRLSLLEAEEAAAYSQEQIHQDVLLSHQGPNASLEDITRKIILSPESEVTLGEGIGQDNYDGLLQTNQRSAQVLTPQQAFLCGEESLLSAGRNCPFQETPNYCASKIVAQSSKDGGSMFLKAKQIPSPRQQCTTSAADCVQQLGKRKSTEELINDTIKVPEHFWSSDDEESDGIAARQSTDGLHPAERGKKICITDVAKIPAAFDVLPEKISANSLSCKAMGSVAKGPMAENPKNVKVIVQDSAEQLDSHELSQSLNGLNLNFQDVIADTDTNSPNAIEGESLEGMPSHKVIKPPASTQRRRRSRKIIEPLPSSDEELFQNVEQNNSAMKVGVEEIHCQPPLERKTREDQLGTQTAENDHQDSINPGKACLPALNNSQQRSHNDAVLESEKPSVLLNNQSSVPEPKPLFVAPHKRPKKPEHWSAVTMPEGREEIKKVARSEGRWSEAKRKPGASGHEGPKHNGSLQFNSFEALCEKDTRQWRLPAIEKAVNATSPGNGGGKGKETGDENFRETYQPPHKRHRKKDASVPKEASGEEVQNIPIAVTEKEVLAPMAVRFKLNTKRLDSQVTFLASLKCKSFIIYCSSKLTNSQD